jgi:glycosyltransferase involved in cell wall biosynthesis
MPVSDEKPSVLLLHNRYREPGGEERSTQEIVNLLAARGHSVSLVERASTALTGVRGRARAGAAMIAGGSAPDEVAAAVKRVGADIVHTQNLNPLFGARGIAAARHAGARIVVHLRNYRLFCAIAIAYRDGALCTRCHGRNTWPGVGLRCRGSFTEAAAYGAGLALHQRRIIEGADSLVVPSEAAARRLESFGMPPGRTRVVANFLNPSSFAEASRAEEGDYALFVGRLVEEKGAETAIAAAARAEVPLVVVGAGPEDERLRRMAGAASVRFTGRLSAEALAEVRRGAAFAVVPSRWDEPFGLVALEAMAAGLPVLASDTGGLPEVVGDDATLPPRAVDRWASAMRGLWSDPALRRERGRAGLERARDAFGAERFYRRLMAVYDEALAK